MTAGPAGPPAWPAPAVVVPSRAGAARRTGKRGVIFGGLLVVALVAGAAAGVFLLRGPAGGHQLAVTVLASQTLQPSDAAQTVSYADKVRVTLPGGTLDRAETLTIGTVDAPPAAPTGFSVLHAYDISLGDRHEFEQPLEIQLAIDRTALEPGSSAADDLFYLRWDETQNVWVHVPASIDDAAGVATLSVTHLSAYGDAKLDAGYKLLKKEQQTKAMAPDPAPHFRIIYDPSLQATIVPPNTPVPDSHPTPRTRQVTGPNDIQLYAFWVGTAAEAAWTAYKKAGLNPPDLTDVVIEKGVVDAYFSFKTCVIEVSTGYVNWPDLWLAMAHELFHVIQSRELGAVMFTNWWFMDATAEYAAGRVASKPGSLPAGLMGQDRKAEYLAFPLTSTKAATEADEGKPRDPESQHAYATAHFLDFVINAYPKGVLKNTDPTARFTDLWVSYVTAANKAKAVGIDALSVLDTWLGRSLADAYKQFAAYFLFNTLSPMPATQPGRLPDGVVNAGALLLRATEKAQSSEAGTIPAPYAARLWSARVVPVGTAPTRSVSVGAVDAIPTGVDLYVFVRPGAAPRAAFPVTSTAATGPKPDCWLFGSQKDCTLTVSPDDVIYLLAVNSGTGSKQLAVTVKEATVELGLVSAQDPNAVPDSGWYLFTATAKGIPNTVKKICLVYDFGDPTPKELCGAMGSQPLVAKAAKWYRDEGSGTYKVTVTLYDTTGSSRVKLAETTISAEIVVATPPTGSAEPIVIQPYPIVLPSP